MRKMHVIPMAMQPPPKEGQKMKSIIVSIVVTVSVVLGSAMAADMPATTGNNQQEETWGARQQVLQEQYQQQGGQQSAWEARQQALQKQNQQQRKQQLQQQTEQQVSPGVECSNQIKSKKELQILKGKIELDASDDPPFEILANNNLPTKKEKKAIFLWISEQKRCKQLGDEWRRNNFSPAINAIVDKTLSDFQFLAADLYAAKISYGGFAKGQVKIIQEAKVNMAAVMQQIREQQKAESQRRDDLAKQQTHQQQQMQQQQKADNEIRDVLEMQMYLQSLQIQQQEQQRRKPIYTIPTPPPKPTYNTNCYTSFDGSVHCTTQ